MNGSRIPAGALIDALQSGRYPFWFPEGAKNLAIDYFAYGTSFLPLGASASTTNPININSDSAFFILSACLVETDTANTTFFLNRPLLCNLQEGGSSRGLFNQALHVDNVYGTAEEPKYWDIPKLLLPNSTFNVTIQNLEAVARNVYVTFHGFKLYQFAK